MDWGRLISRPHRVVRSRQAAMVRVHCFKRVGPGSRFGGVGQSGYGREMGFEVMHEYTNTKSVRINVDSRVRTFYPRSH